MKTTAFLFLFSMVAMTGFTPSAHAGQPKMQAALSELRAARASLEQAVADKAGHRVKAIALVDQAIAQVESGIQAGR
jgi:hypothetical protein